MGVTGRLAWACSMLLLGLALGRPSGAQGVPVRVWTTRAIATVLAAAGPQFESESGHRLVVSSGLPTDFARQFDRGESVDLVISGDTWIDRWIREGRLVASSRADVARSGIGVEVKAGTQTPDVASVEAFRRALLAAPSVGYLKVGSGLHMETVVRRLGIEQAIAAKLVRPDTDIVSELVAKGELALGITVITQILTTPGVVLAGPLPAELQSYVTFTAGVSATAASPAPAAALLAFLDSPPAIAVMKAQGMEPR